MLDGSGDAPYVAGELVVTYKPGGAAEVAAAASREAEGARVEKELPEIKAQLLSFPEVKNDQAGEDREGTLEQTKQALEQNPAVEAVDYNYIYKLAFSPNDPLFSGQYSLIRPGFPQAWDTIQGAGAQIATVDTGAFGGHVDLAGKIAEQYDFVNDDGDANDDNGHGTHVSGIAAAVTNNSQGIAGGCPDCSLLIAKTFNAAGNGTLADAAEGITWSADHGAEVINVSFGGPTSVALGNAINYAAGKGVVLVAAAGNNSSNRLFFPAAYPNVIAVAATNRFNRGVFFSNYGRWVDVAAPGVNIVSTAPNGGYGVLSGTSQASSEVAALAGLLAAQGRSRSEITSRILGTVTKLTNRNVVRHKKKHRKKHRKKHHRPDPYYGRGRINAALAVR